MKCQQCKQEVDDDEIEIVRVGKKKLKLCDECAEIIKEEQNLQDYAENAIQDMMGYKGKY